MSTGIATDVINIVADIGRLGETVAGGTRELHQLEIIKSLLEGHVDEISFEPVEVLSWYEQYCVVYVDGLPHICAIHPPYNGYIDIDVYKDSIVYVKSIRDIAKALHNINDKLIIVDDIDDPNDVAVYSYIIRRYNPIAILFIDRYNTIRRIVTIDDMIPRYKHVSPPLIPAIHIDAETGYRIRKTNNDIHILAKSITGSSYGYNVIARIHGSDSGLIYLTAHHDHWFNGVIDDVLGVAILSGLVHTSVLHLLTRNSIALAFFTAEEGLPNPLSSFYWLIGSRKHVIDNIHRLLNDAVFVINIDTVYKGKIKFASSNIVMRGFLSKLGISNDNIEHDNIMFDSFAFTLLGIPSMTIHSYEEVLSRGLYHSTLDSLEVIDRDVIDNIINILMNIIKNSNILSNSSHQHEFINAGIKSLINEISSRVIPLEITANLYKVLKKIYSYDNIQKIYNHMATLHRIIVSTYISKAVLEGRDIYEKTSYIFCSNEHLHIPVAPEIDLDSECYRNLLHNLESLTYILFL